jgi:hypothetical protein
VVARSTAFGGEIDSSDKSAVLAMSQCFTT